MNINETKLPGLENNDIPIVQCKKRRHPEHLPRLHFLSLFCGSRGSGKTVAICNLLKRYDKTKSFDRIIIFCPTLPNQPLFRNLIDTCKYAKFELYEDFTHEKFAEIKFEMDKRIEEYKKYERDLALYKKYKQFSRTDKAWDNFNDDDLIYLNETEFERPETEYKNGLPTTLLWFDDNMENPILFGKGKAAAAINNFTILHRHKCCSIIWSVQAMRTGGYGVPKAIRNNLSFMCLYRNKSPQVQKDIAMECCSFCEPSEFINYWNYATQEKHSFFYVDYDADPPYNLRKNFNTLLSHANVSGVTDVTENNGNNNPNEEDEVEEVV